MDPKTAGEAAIPMFNKNMVHTSRSIVLTVACSTAIAVIAAVHSGWVGCLITIVLWITVLYGQFTLAKFQSTQSVRKYRYQQLGRKLVHLKRIKKRDETIALKVLNHIVNQSTSKTGHARIWQRPFENFSGDLALACQSECGRTYLLVADLTGHGIAAAMGATPVASIFQATTKRGLSVEQIVLEMNNRLTQLLPSGFFCCAAIGMCENRRITICNAGLPDMLVVKENGAVADRIKSTQLPLGIQELSVNDVQTFTKTYNTSHQLYAFTDGLIETQSANDETFDTTQLEGVIASQPFASSRIPVIRKGFEEFVKGSQQNDDISIVEVNIC